MSTLSELKTELKNHFNFLRDKINNSYEKQIQRIKQQQHNTLLMLETQFKNQMNYLNKLQQRKCINHTHNNNNNNNNNNIKQEIISKCMKTEQNQYDECYKIKCDLCINQFQCSSQLEEHMIKFHMKQNNLPQDQSNKHDDALKHQYSYTNQSEQQKPNDIDRICQQLKLKKKVHLNVYGFNNHTQIYQFIHKLVQIKSDDDRNQILEELTQNKLRDIKSKIYSRGCISQKKELLMGIKNKLINMRNDLSID